MKVYTRYFFSRNFPPLIREKYIENALLEVSFQIKWDRIPPEPRAGFPLTRYEPVEIHITELVEISYDGSSRTWNAKDLSFDVIDDLVGMVEHDLPQHILDSAEEDYESAQSSK